MRPTRSRLVAGVAGVLMLSTGCAVGGGGAGTTADREQELVLARANAIVNQCYVVNVNAVPSIGGGRSIGVDPHGRVLFELGLEEGFAIETLDLTLVRDAREHGSRGLSRVLAHARGAPPAIFRAARPPRPSR